MKSNEILSLLEKFDWQKLGQIYGCAHSSIIGFIAYHWLKESEHNSVLDGAPSPIIGSKRKGQKNSDLLLCKNEEVYIPVEVETTVSKYKDKFDALTEYKESFHSVQFGLLYMTNLITGTKKYQHNWDDIKNKVRNSKNAMALVSSIKRKVNKNETEWSKLLRRNDYSSWQITQIDYWIYDKIGNEIEGNLWKDENVR